jgi:branched-chain amino acid transport system substrate-binding protein
VTTDKKLSSEAVSRRRLLRQAVATGVGLGALSFSAPSPFGFTRAFAVGVQPIGTYPAGSGSSVTIGAAVPLTGTYAQSGADELKGYQLAVEHINEGHELIKKIAPKVSKGRARQDR